MNHDKQLTQITHKWFVTLLITLAVGSVFYCWERIKVNIGEIEFSSSLSGFIENIGTNVDVVQANIYYDFIFIIVYTALFYFSYRVFQSSMRVSVSKLWILLCMLPGILDCIENLLLLYLINNQDTTLVFSVLWCVVRAKWTLAIPFIIINFYILIYYLLQFINSFFK